MGTDFFSTSVPKCSPAQPSGDMGSELACRPGCSPFDSPRHDKLWWEGGEQGSPSPLNGPLRALGIGPTEGASAGAPMGLAPWGCVDLAAWNRTEAALGYPSAEIYTTSRGTLTPKVPVRQREPPAG